jgi:hypothetical protein
MTAATPTDPAARDVAVLGLHFALRVLGDRGAWRAQVTGYGVTEPGRATVADLPHDFLGNTMSWSEPGEQATGALDALEVRLLAAVGDAVATAKQPSPSKRDLGRPGSPATPGDRA